ncbi:hypothetical protein [Bombiscardovia coagulans]|uniref:hypothetical protein n=1 Tax=Bombiscardovia coagulans TaxID=686666 RepID=UPI000B9B729F|nr:hypothetical protein [Bombiscardovia coagulans]
MKYTTVIDSLWRNDKDLKFLNVVANTAAMVLVFTLFEALLTPALQGDTGSAPGVLFICLACAICVCKVVADHTFTAQWGQLMRLRIVGASPIKLLIASVLLQAKLSLLSALAGSLLGVMLTNPLEYLYRSLDICLPNMNFRILIVAFSLTVVAAVVSGVIGAGISAYRVISFPPDLTTGIKTVRKSRNHVFSFLLLLIISCLLVLLVKRNYDSFNPFLGVVICFLWAWFLIRTAGPFLHSISTCICQHSQNHPVLLLAFRDKQAATSTSLYTLITIATMMLGAVYCMYGYTDADARASISHATSQQKSVAYSESLSTEQFLQHVKQIDKTALSLSATTAFPKNSNSSCESQKTDAERYMTTENAYAVTNGSPEAILPKTYVAQGNLKMDKGIIATASTINANGNPIAVGDIICTTSNNVLTEIPVRAVVKFPGTLGDYFVVGVSSSGNKNIAFTESAVGANQAGADFTVMSVDEWIQNIPSGKVISKTGGNGVKEAAPIVYPVIAICLIGAISIIFNILSERKYESNSTWLIDFGRARFALTQVIGVVFELLLSFGLTMISSVAIINISLRGESSVLSDGIHYFVPVPQFVLLFLTILMLGVVTYFVSSALYQKNEII